MDLSAETNQTLLDPATAHTAQHARRLISHNNMIQSSDAQVTLYTVSQQKRFICNVSVHSTDSLQSTSIIFKKYH